AGRGRVLERSDPQIDLGHLEAGDLDSEIEVDQRELLQLLREQPVIPDGDLGEPVVGDHERLGLRAGQVVEAQRRHFGYAGKRACEQTAVTGDHGVVAIYHDRDNEAERLKAVGNLPDLLVAVVPRVGAV